MTDEYLITMLRNNVGVSEAACRAAKAAADRIEQLIVEKEAATAAAYEAAAQVINDRGAVEQENFGLDRATQNFFRARDLVRALATPDQTAVQPAQVTLDDQERNYLHLHNAAFDVWRWFETARPDLIGPRAEKLRDAVMGPRPFGCVEPQPDPRDAVIARLVEALEIMRSTYPYNPPCYGWQEQVEAHKAAKAALAAAKEMQSD